MLVKRIAGWLEERLGFSGAAAALLGKPIAGGARYIFSLGYVNLFLFVNQVLTGMFLSLYYVPSPDHAYDSVKFIQGTAAMGHVVRGLHYWGASAMIVSLMLHAARVFTWGAYKKPRELMWVSGSLLLMLVFGFAFTGYLLPWDQKSYWATVVGTSIAGTAPVAGDLVMKVMRGGADVSSMTLTRFFALHTMFLPWLLALVAGVHLTVLQFVDHTPPWDPEKAEVAAPFYPDQVFKDMVLALVVFAAVIFLASVSPAPIEALADPTDKTYNPRPEWYFYFLFQLLHYTEGRFEIIGTMVLPNLFAALLLLIPFIDRGPERNPLKRPVAMGGMGAALACYAALTLIAAFQHPPAAVERAASATEGRKLFLSLGCASCHSTNGVGGKVGPPLDGVARRRDRQWLGEHFKDPQRLSPGSVMPGYAYLSDEKLEQLTEYMLTLK